MRELIGNSLHKEWDDGAEDLCLRLRTVSGLCINTHVDRETILDAPWESLTPFSRWTTVMRDVIDEMLFAEDELARPARYAPDV